MATASERFKEEENSIILIEARIGLIRDSDTAKTKASIAEIKRLKTQIKKVYSEYKHKVMEFEKNNHGYMVLLCSTHGFYKMFGNSLHFYAYDIAPKLNIEAKVLSDGDYEDRSEHGVVSINSIDELDKKLKQLKIKRANMKDKTGNIVMYKLPWEYSDNEIKKLIQQNSYDLHKYNHVIMVENIIPTLYLNLNDLMRACYENVRRLEPVAREMLGEFFVTTAAEMLRIYIEMANGRLKETEGLEMIRTRLNRIKSQLKILVDLKLWNANTYVRIGEIIIKTQGVVDLRLKGEG